MKKQLAIIGWGSQTQAWAANLAQEGWDIHIYLRAQSHSHNKVKNAGFEVYDLESLGTEEWIALLIPDHEHLSFLEQNHAYLNSKAHLILAHGYSYTAFQLEQKYPHLAFVLLAPKAIASELRARKLKKQSLAAVWQMTDASQRDVLQLIMQDLGITYQLESSFEEETRADLLSEQGLLCSLLPYGALKNFNLLVEKGIKPELAFLECWMELKLIADTLVSRGPEAFFKLISPNALIGSHKAAQNLLGETFESHLKELYSDIESGQFYRECQQTNAEELRDQLEIQWGQTKLQQTYEKLKDIVQDTSN